MPSSAQVDIDQRPLILAHGSLRTASFRDRVHAAAQAGVPAIGLHVREYDRLRGEGWSDSDIRAVLSDADVRILEVETMLGWDERPEDRDEDGLKRESLAMQMADAFGVRHIVAVGALTGDTRPSATDGFAALCARAAEHGLQVALEPQACSSIADLQTAAAIVSAAGQPNGGLNIDIWHQTRGGWPLSSLAALDPGDIVVVQVDDGPEEPVTDDYLIECTSYRCAPGEGHFDIGSFLAALYATGTDAPISIEVLSNEYDTRPARETALKLASATRRCVESAQATLAASAVTE